MNTLGNQPPKDAVRRFKERLEADPEILKNAIPAKIACEIIDRWLNDQAAIPPNDLVAVIYGRDDKKHSAENLYPHRVKANKLLKKFCTVWNTEFEFHAQISEKPYGLIFGEPSSPADEETPTGPFEIFWKAHLSAKAPPILVFTSPLFFRDDQYHYVRDIHINDVQDQPKLDGFLGPGAHKSLKPTRHYYSAGEVNAALQFLTEFCDRGVRPDWSVIWSDGQLPELGERNLIAIGSGRTSWFLQDQQEQLMFVVEQTQVTDRSVNPPASFEDKVGPNRTARFAVLTRLPTEHPGLTTTLIGANHGRAAEGVAEYVLREEDLNILLQKLTVDGVLAETFQVLFQVEIRSQDEAVILDVRPIKIWSPSLAVK